MDLDEAFPLPNLDEFDLSELSCDETASPTSSTASSPLGSPISMSLDIQLDSPSSSSAPSNGSASTCTSPTFSRQDSEGSTSSTSSSSRGSKHRAKCNTPNCVKKEHVSVVRRNERERNRVRLVSDGFTSLRKHIPTTPTNKKLSKVETLKNAIDYIRYLQRVLNESNRIERERKLLRQVGWLQNYKLQAQNRGNLTQQDQINALLSELPDIAPYPCALPQVNGLTNTTTNPVGYYYSPVG